MQCKLFQTSCRIFIPAGWAHPLLRGPIFSWCDPSDWSTLFFCIWRPLFPINKQFSIDSFLDWERLHWDFCSPPSSLQRSQFLPSDDSSQRTLLAKIIFKFPIYKMIFYQRKNYSRPEKGQGYRSLHTLTIRVWNRIECHCKMGKVFYRAFGFQSFSFSPGCLHKFLSCQWPPGSTLWCKPLPLVHYLISVYHLFWWRLCWHFLIGLKWHQLTSPMGIAPDWFTPEFTTPTTCDELGLGEVASSLCWSVNRSKFVESMTGLLISFIIFLDRASPSLLACDAFLFSWMWMILFESRGISVELNLDGRVLISLSEYWMLLRPSCLLLRVS